MTNQPVTDNDWIIHSLNIHGSFFQRKCVDMIINFPIQTVRTNIRLVETEYPVEYPPRKVTDFKNKESRLDILARIRSENYPNYAMDVVIECKKNNPEFTNWIFFEKYPDSGQKQSFVGTYVGENGGAFYTAKNLKLPGYISSDGREVKQNYSNINSRDKTRTTNTNIEDACYQVVLATHSLIDEQFTQFTLPAERRNNELFILYLYIPMIVTTANLYISDYDVSNVSIDKGEIPFDKTNLKLVDSLWYEYPVPPHLQLINEKWGLNPSNAGKDFTYRRCIYIVNSVHFHEALIYLYGKATDLLDFG
jgi:hypothetical protein